MTLIQKKDLKIKNGSDIIIMRISGRLFDVVLESEVQTMFKSDNSLDTIRQNLTNFFMDLTEFFKRVYNAIKGLFEGFPQTTSSDAEGTSEVE